MRNDQGDIDITEYLERLPDRGRCLTAGDAPVSYIEDRSRLGYLSDKPFIVGLGAIECSTCVTLVRRPEVIWDANRYYRSLGFSFPYTRISRKQLRLGFYDRGGPDSARLMFVLKQLLNTSTRRKYDNTPLGEVFLDEWVQKFLKDKAVQEAVRRSAESGRTVEPEEVLAEWGMEVQPEKSTEDVEPSGEAGYGEAPGKSTPKDESESPESSDSPPIVVPWSWAYYVWRSQRDDRERLARWQQLLVQAFAARNVVRRFAVGFFGKQPHRFLLGEVDGRDVFFLGEDEEPTEEMAALAVVQMLYDRHRQVTGVQYGQLPQRRQAG